MNFPVKETTEDLKRKLEASLGDVHFQEMLIHDADRANALRNGAVANNRDEKAFLDALKQVTEIRNLLKK